jgi:hypothetical protein
MIVRPLLAALFLGVAGCAAAAAGGTAWPSDAAYAHVPGDTLRYLLTTESTGSVGMEGAPGEGGWKTVREARIALAFTGQGRAVAWIESAREETPGSGQPVRTAGPEVVGRPFALQMGRRGIDSVETDTPIHPDWSDLGDEVRALLPRLPGGPLSRGRLWKTESGEDLSSPSEEGRQTRTATYRVAGDTVIGRARVVMVEYESVFERRIRSRTAPTVPPGSPPLAPFAVHRYEGEQGRFYFDRAAGRLVRRTRAGSHELSGPDYGLVDSTVQVRAFSETLELVSSSRDSAGRGS